MAQSTTARLGLDLLRLCLTDNLPIADVVPIDRLRLEPAYRRLPVSDGDVFTKEFHLDGLFCEHQESSPRGTHCELGNFAIIRLARSPMRARRIVFSLDIDLSWKSAMVRLA
jgi:hypothetical protein